MIPIHIDNKNNLSWLTKDTSPISYLPILHPLYTMMRENRIRLYPIWICSKANKLADLASRGDLEELESLLPEWKKHAVELPQNVPLPMHDCPGPLFLFKHGYVDGRKINETWTTPYADTMDEPHRMSDMN